MVMNYMSWEVSILYLAIGKILIILKKIEFLEIGNYHPQEEQEEFTIWKKEWMDTWV